MVGKEVGARLWRCLLSAWRSFLGQGSGPPPSGSCLGWLLGRCWLRACSSPDPPAWGWLLVLLLGRRVVHAGYALCARAPGCAQSCLGG